MPKRNWQALENQSLFYEEIGSEQPTASEDNNYDHKPCLSEEQISKLSDDLRQPMQDSKPSSNPLQ